MIIEERFKLKLPCSAALKDVSFICAGGTILASQISLKCNLGIHLGDEFHYAFADYGEGFCVFNDAAVAGGWDSVDSDDTVTINYNACRAGMKICLNKEKV